jgi:hypothetical protein
MRLADDGPDMASRERGRGYRDGLNACRADVDDSAPSIRRWVAAAIWERNQSDRFQATMIAACVFSRGR